jgi:antirestriction protein ArdC
MKRNFYKKVTKMIVKALKKGVGPWIRPWNGPLGWYRNAYSDRPYQGINILLLNLYAWKYKFASNLWLTKKQAEKLGGYVKPGEKSAIVIFWGKTVKIQKEFDEDLLAKKIEIPVARIYEVFNIEQCENLRFSRETDQKAPADSIISAERLLSLPQIIPGDIAAYNSSRDNIVLPPREAFKSKDDFYATAFHELIHWTGHPSRLNRDFSGKFGDRSYAMEELVAEMGAAFLGAYVGLKIQKLQHPEYIGSWIKVLENNSQAIFTAARLAQKACDWLLKESGLTESSDKEKIKTRRRVKSKGFFSIL